MRNVIRLVSKWTEKAAGRTLKTGKQRNLINSDISEYARCYWLATVLLPPQVLSAWLLDVSDYTNTTIPLSPQCFLPYYWMSVITPIPPFPSPLSAFCLTTGRQWLHQYQGWWKDDQSFQEVKIHKGWAFLWPSHTHRNVSSSSASSKSGPCIIPSFHQHCWTRWIDGTNWIISHGDCGT